MTSGTPTLTLRKIPDGDPAGGGAAGRPALDRERHPDGRPRAPRGYRWSLLVLGVTVLLGLIAFKSTAVQYGTFAQLFLVYSVLVTGFVVSRLIAAAFHERTMRTCYPPLTSTYEPTISFVIPCKNEEGAIAHTVEQCLAADYPAEKVEVIVINDGSTDRTGEILRELAALHPRLTVVDWEVNRGKRHGMAEGFRRATGELIIQLDSDSYIEPASVREMVRPFENPRMGAVCAHADPANADQNFLTKIQAAYYFVSFRVLKAAESSFLTVFCCSGCSSAYRRDLVLPMLDDWLDERFLGRPVTWGDDRALTNRVLRAGYYTIYTDRAQAYTICPDTLRQLLKQQVRWKKGWMVNSFFASPFVLRQYPFVALTYFFPLILLTLLTPFMAGRALFYEPLVDGTLPVYYIVGVLSIAVLITIFYRYVRRENKYWPYVFAWSVLNMFVLSFVLFYAILTIQNRRWGTR